MGQVPTVLQGVAEAKQECRSHPYKVPYSQESQEAPGALAVPRSIASSGQCYFPEWREGCCHLTCPFKQRSPLAHLSQPKSLPFTEVRVT